MLDRDLAELYGVETKQLKRAVRRNIKRFPEDFMFEMSNEELENWRYQFGTSNKEKMGLRIPPFVFTEHGAIMLASVLNSNRAIRVNIQIIRIFNKMREIIKKYYVLTFGVLWGNLRATMRWQPGQKPVSYTHLTLPTTPYV